MFFSEHIIRFIGSLTEAAPLVPEGITLMNPYTEERIRDISKQFFRKFYSDDRHRMFIFGINPGRFGAGVTGISFTDPIRLETVCGIPNDLEKKRELSSVFVYEMIDRFGGPSKFYSRFFLTALCPLGFTRNGLNMNYYDDKYLEARVKPFIVDSILTQMGFGCETSFAICLGEGKNYRFFNALNEEHHFFGKIIPLAHPRFIMQYRLKRKEEFLQQYLDALGSKM